MVLGLLLLSSEWIRRLLLLCHLAAVLSSEGLSELLLLHVEHLLDLFRIRCGRKLRLLHDLHLRRVGVATESLLFGYLTTAGQLHRWVLLVVVLLRKYLARSNTARGHLHDDSGATSPGMHRHVLLLALLALALLLVGCFRLRAHLIITLGRSARLLLRLGRNHGQVSLAERNVLLLRVHRHTQMIERFLRNVYRLVLLVMVVCAGGWGA